MLQENFILILKLTRNGSPMLKLFEGSLIYGIDISDSKQNDIQINTSNFFEVRPCIQNCTTRNIKSLI